MKLYGSTTSPFVRRLRIYLAERDYELIPVNIFGLDRKEIKKRNPTLKIPMFEDENNPDCPVLIDSGVIYNYLANKFDESPLSFSQQNDLAIINACNDSLVNMMILKRSGVDTSEDKLYFKIQHERNATTFSQLNQEIIDGKFSEWNYVTISLLVLVEWAQFRELFDFSDCPALLQFVADNQNRPGVTSTKPHE